MKVRIDKAKCQAYGNCADEAPGLFQLDASGYGEVIGNGSVPAGEEQAAKNAVASCPANAISVEE